MKIKCTVSVVNLIHVHIHLLKTPKRRRRAWALVGTRVILGGVPIVPQIWEHQYDKWYHVHNGSNTSGTQRVIPKCTLMMSYPAQNTSHGWQSAFLAQWPLLLPLLLTPTSEGREGLSGDVTVRSKAAGLPQSQLEARMSAGGVCWSSRPSPLPASALALMQA